MIAAPARLASARTPRLLGALTRDRAVSTLVSGAAMRLLMGTIAQRRLRLASLAANARTARPGFFSFELIPGEPGEISAGRIRFSGGKCVIGLNRHLPDSPRLYFMLWRLNWTLPILAGCRDLEGETWLNLDDVSIKPGLAYSAGPGHFLIPDPVYMAERGYRRIARAYLKSDPPWAERRPVAFWRGSTTGYCAPGAWRSLERARLCEIAATRPDLFDAGLAGLAQRTAEDCEAIRNSGLMRPPVPATHFIRYRYQIDIDGNSNSWPGLFGKLLTGAPVLKITSARGYRQWYYDRLIPWGNFVPVAADMSDLVEKAEWLLAHDGEAQRIGAAGRALALSMTVPAELSLARATVAAALRSQ